MEFIIQGMRNPMNSWDKKDSREGCEHGLCWKTCNFSPHWCGNTPRYVLGENDLSLMQHLSNAGTEHRKYMRMMPVYVRITAGHTWWAEFDTYKIGTVRNSCSKMHKIHVMGFEADSFDHEGIDEVGEIAVETFDKVRETLTWLAKMFNETKEKKYWRAIIELLPLGFHLTANIMLNYEVLADIYRQRKNHKLDEWRAFCKWIKTLPYSELITGEEEKRMYSDIDHQTIVEKRFPQPYINEDDTRCDKCENFRDCLNNDGLAEVTTSDDVVKNGFKIQHYINKPGYDCPKAEK